MIVIKDDMRNNKQYNGNTYKFGITVNNTDFIIKYPKGDDMSVFCEYIASKFINKLGIPCHEVLLGIHDNRVVDVIKDFTSGTDLSLHSFKSTKQSSEDTDMTFKEYTYEDVLYLIDKHLKMSDSDKKMAKIQFWDMFIVDAILGNRDRHWGNWGYLAKDGRYKIAPLYDNGASLYPNVNNVILDYVDINKRYQFIYDRVYTFPASLFRIRRPDRSYRSIYSKMFKDLRINKAFASRVKNITNNYEYIDIYNIIKKIVWGIPTEALDTVYKRFYIHVVAMRYMCIVKRLDFKKSYSITERLLNNENWQT